MAIEKLSALNIGIDEIEIGARLRPTGEAGLAQLMTSIAAIGLLHPIQVRRIYAAGEGAPRIVLMAGAHRLEAARRLGWAKIPAQQWRCSNDEARLFEIDDNLASAELTALDRAVFMAERKRVYLALHPESAQGGDRKSTDFKGKNQNEIISFCSATAAQHGKSTRWAEQYSQIGERLTAEDVARVRALGLDTRLADLMSLAKLDPAKRQVALGAVERGARSVAEARRMVEAGRAEPVSDLAAKLARARAAFERLPEAGRRLLLAEIAARYPGLMDEALRHAEERAA